MHIEIYDGPLGITGTITGLYEHLNGMIRSSEDVISSFITVQNKALSLNGGIGILGEAVEYVGERIKAEEDKLSHAKEVLNQTIAFTGNTIATDKEVAAIVSRNKEAFYRMHPWLRPPRSEDEKSFLERAYEYVKEGFRKTGAAIDEAFQAIGDTLRKGWDMLVEFYEAHKKTIQTVLIIIGAVSAITALIAGGGLLVLAPLLISLGISAPVAAAISGTVAVIAAVSTIASSSLNIADIWLEIDAPLFNTIQKTLNITAAISNALVSIGALYNSFHPGALEDAKKQIMAHRNQPKAVPRTESTSTVKFDDKFDLVDRPYQQDEYFLKGKHSDEYLDFYQKGFDSAARTDVVSPQMEMVDPGNIEGVYLHGNEVHNPEIFYRNSSRMDYLNYLSRGAENTPIELYQAIDHGKFYYIFAGNGRHRIIAAKELGVRIPAIIKTIYKR